LSITNPPYNWPMNKTILIIGASSGIGEALARAYAHHGWQVGIAARSADKLAAIAAAFPDQIKTFVLDVTANDALDHLQHAFNTLGKVDIFVYSSGTGMANSPLDEKIELDTVAVNVTAFTRFVVAAYHYFEQKGGGQLVAFSSVASRRGDRGSPAYNASKAFESNYLEGLRKKAFRRKLNLTITDIRPGFVDTAMAQGPGLFWVAPVEKAALQIKKAIENKRAVAYITKRWFYVAKILEWLPPSLWHRL